MSLIIPFMSFSNMPRRNRGAYGSPFSGIGVEFHSLGTLPDHTGVVLHETGWIPENDRWNFATVLSPFWRLYWNGKSGHEVVFPQGQFALSPNRILLIPDHQLFECRGSDPAPHLWLHFQVARRADPRQPIPILLVCGPTEIALLEELERLHRENSQNRERLFHACLALLHRVLSRPELRWQPPAPSRFLRIIRHIETHHATGIAIPDLAQMAGLCPTSFGRAFKQHFKRTPARFIMEVRTREAAALLANTDDTLDDIAEKTGFPNRDYFSRVFRAVTGESPARFRRTCHSLSGHSGIAGARFP